MRFKNFLFRHWALTLATTVILIQVVPYGHDHENPPVTREPKWDTGQTRDLAERACFSATAMKRIGHGTATSLRCRGLCKAMFEADAVI